jgi:putative transposase
MEVEEARRAAGTGRRERAAQTRGSRSSRADPDPQRGKRKKMVSPSSRRRAAKYLVEEGLSNAAQACRALGLARSSYYLAPQQRARAPKRLNQKIMALSEEHPRYGYRRITALLRRNGKQVNPKRVQRVRYQAGLQVSKRQKRTRRVGPSLVKRFRAERANQVWSWDLLYDQTEGGRSLRILTLIDEHTKGCLAIHAGYSVRALDAINILEAAIAGHGTPQHIRSDNGPEFIAKAIQDCLKAQRIESLYIKPGSPWEQAYIESFHDSGMSA